ncbi:hypothetical protein GJ744_010964 [Endocarpon pusillum]|uniref:Uncharacterized protein n=1 Tax=Endocarpon pusillum TaxID=364733 RepID=A0A8H7AH92_9EURO|nr:hypothetical protein GJ744_010964 [Endocarpon pusillum]
MVFGAHTWLHFTTKSTIFTQVAPNIIRANHGFILYPQCIDNPNPYSGLGGCTIAITSTYITLLGGSTKFKVLNNVSETTMVKTVSRDGTEFAYRGNTPQSQLSAIDYTANSWAVESKCVPVTTECMDGGQFYGAGSPFKCPFAFEGELSEIYPNPWQMMYFTNASPTDNSTESGPVPNPYFFSVAASVNQLIGRDSGPKPEPKRPRINECFPWGCGVRSLWQQHRL